MEEKESLKCLKEQRKFIVKHLKWCKENNKPKEHLDAHMKILNEIRAEIKTLKNNIMTKGKVEINGTEFQLELKPGEKLNLTDLCKRLNGDDVKVEDCIFKGKNKFKQEIKFTE